jgi:uncharacterized protein YggE
MATITVSGVGIASGTPDEATLVLGVETVRPTAAEALEDVAARTSELVALCGELGVGPGAISTAGVSVGEHGEADSEGRWQRRGYRAANRISVRVGDAKLVGDLLTGAVDRVGASVEGPAWRLLPDNKAHAEAARLAALDARRRAEAYAAALGGRIGVIASVRDAGLRPPEPRPAMRATAMEATVLPVEAGEQDVTVVVEVEFTLEQE